MEQKLRILDNLVNIKEHNNVALEGDLICNCGNIIININTFLFTYIKII